MNTEATLFDAQPSPDVAESLTHALLIEQATRWLWKQRCKVVITDMASQTPETPDAIGWRGSQSILVECKVSVADFRADAKKQFRVEPHRGMGYQRWFCAPRGLLTNEGLPDGWGLLEWDGRRLTIVRESQTHRHHEGARAEIALLLSSIRRIGAVGPPGVSVKFYTMESKNRATLGVSDSDSDADEPLTPESA